MTMSVNLSEESTELLHKLAQAQNLEPNVMLERIILGWKAMGLVILGQPDVVQVEDQPATITGPKYAFKVNDVEITADTIGDMIVNFATHIGLGEIYKALVNAERDGFMTALVQSRIPTNRHVVIKDGRRTWYVYINFGYETAIRKIEEVCQLMGIKFEV